MAEIAKAGHNSLAEEGKAFVGRIENLEDEIQEATETFKEDTITPLKADIKAIYDEVKAAGLTKKAIKAVVTARKKAREAERERLKLGPVDMDAFDNIRHALGDIAGTPLGDFAERKASAAASA